LPVKIFISALAVMLILSGSTTAAAAVLFGPPQTVSREAGGLNTAIGYWYRETKLENSVEHVFRQNEIYSQVSYGSGDRWELYGRLGVADLQISDAFSSGNAATITSGNDFQENWKFFGTLGAKWFLPINKIFGVGAFIQGTYYFNNFTGDVAGTAAGTPFAADLKVRDMWDVNFGLGLQTVVNDAIKLYAGPYLHYAEAKLNLSADITGIEFGTTAARLKNNSSCGGFIGADMPLGKGFRLNIEGQYAEQFSLGAAISYTY